jgi:hypothetical protein
MRGRPAAAYLWLCACGSAQLRQAFPAPLFPHRYCRSATAAAATAAALLPQNCGCCGLPAGVQKLQHSLRECGSCSQPTPRGPALGGNSRRPHAVGSRRQLPPRRLAHLRLTLSKRRKGLKNERHIRYLQGPSLLPQELTPNCRSATACRTPNNRKLGTTGAVSQNAVQLRLFVLTAEHSARPLAKPEIQQRRLGIGTPALQSL